MSNPRKSAVLRAEQHSPFLREALRAHPEIGECFVRDGAEAPLLDGDADPAFPDRNRGLALLWDIQGPR